MPFPWNIPDESRREEYTNVFNTDKKTVEKAFMVLELSLEVLSHYEFPEGKLIPKEMNEYWNFTAASISQKISTIEEFDLIKIKEVFSQNNIDSPSESMIEEAGHKWFWTIANDIATDSIRWLKKALRNCQDPELVTNYLTIASRYWQSSIPDDIICSLVAGSKRIAGKRAIPLLKEVEENTQDKELADLAKDFKQLILDPNYR